MLLCYLLCYSLFCCFNGDSASSHCRNTSMMQEFLKLVYIDTCCFFKLMPLLNSLQSHRQSFVSYSYAPFSNIDFRLLIAAIKVVYCKILNLKEGIIFEIVRIWFFWEPSGIDKIQKRLPDIIFSLWAPFDGNSHQIFYFMTVLSYFLA